MLASKLAKLQRFPFEETMTKSHKKRTQLRSSLEHVDETVAEKRAELEALERTIAELEAMARLLPPP